MSAIKRISIGAGFLSLAAAVHIAVGWQARPGVIAASGSGGTDLLSLAAVNTEIAAVVEAVDRPPVLETDIAPNVSPPPAQDSTPIQPSDVKAPETPAAIELPQMMGAGVAMPQRPAAPEAPASPPPPPTPPEPVKAKEPPPERPVMSSPTPPRRPERPQPVKSAERQTAPPKAPPNSTRNVEGQNERRAAGVGGGSVAGRNGSNDVSGEAKARQVDLRRTWGARIAQRVQRRALRSFKGSGTAVVRILVSSDGRLSRVSLARSSGNSAVDEAAIDSVRRAGRFPKAPAGISTGNHQFDLPILINS